MPTDTFGNPISGGRPETIAAIDAFVTGLIGYRDGLGAILAAAEAEPDHALANIYAGFLHLLGEHGGAADAARPFAEAAARGRLGARERALLDALQAWIGDDEGQAIGHLSATLDAWPRDLLTLKLLHYHQFNRGDFAGMLGAAETSLAAAPEIGPVHGMASFALEQLHRLREAEAAARHALALSERDPWAEHTLAHVMLTEGRTAEGIAFLEGARGHWAGLNSFMLTHLWWHLALFYLSSGRGAAALAAYDDVVWAIDRSYSQDQIGAVSLLARIDLAKIDVGARWQDLADHLEARERDVVQPFLSVQYLYGLARAGRPKAETLLAAIEERGARDGGIWRAGALPLARGLLAHARGDFDAARIALADAVPRLATLGGSHAQRDLFGLILRDATIRSAERGAT